MAHAVRAMPVFVGCISADVLQHPLIKDSVSDMLVALHGILQSENETVLGPATNATEKLFRSLGSSVCQYHFSEIIFPLSNLLSFHQSTVVIASAVALKCILTNLRSTTREDGIWDIIKETKAIENIVHILLDCLAGLRPIDYFIEITSLLRTILWRWPPSRYQVWNNTELMTGLVIFCANSDPSVVVSILQLYSTLALCGDVAIMLLKSTPSLVSEVVLYMHSSQPTNVRIEALIFCEHLMRSERECNILTHLCGESLVQGIINAMGGWRSSHSKKVPTDQMPLVTAACRAALITRWPGGHHASFWKLGIDSVLLDLLLGKYKRSSQLKDPDVLRAAAYDSVTGISSYVWDILGWLAMHCEEGFHSQKEEKMSYLDTLIHCACTVAVDLMLMRSPSHHHSILRSSCTSEVAPVSRAVVMMVLSPCNYIASRTRDLLWEIVSFDDNNYLNCLLDTLKLNYISNGSMASDNLQLVVNLMSLVYYSSLPQCQRLIHEKRGIETLISIIDRCLKGDIYISRSSVAPHLCSSNAKACCWNYVEEWKSGNIILLYSLQALSQLISFSDITRNCHGRSFGQISLGSLSDNSTAQSLFCNLQQILSDGFSPEFKCDVILETKGNEVVWNCSTCHMLLPHMHVHKIILCSSSTYMQGLFRSGMQESHSQVIKVPICWEALVKLVTWFYSGELPKLEFQCAWNNMNSEKQFKELLVYVELSWLAEFWCLDDVYSECLEVVTSCSSTNQKFLLKILESAVSLGQCKIVEAVLSSLAPLYPRLRDAGDLEVIGEEVVQMLQSEYVHYSQGGHLCIN